jgi:hypothetical protein
VAINRGYHARGLVGPETFPVLQLLCLHVALAEELAKAMNAATRTEDIRKLGIALERETRQIRQLSAAAEHRGAHSALGRPDG